MCKNESLYCPECDRRFDRCLYCEDELPQEMLLSDFEKFQLREKHMLEFEAAEKAQEENRRKHDIPADSDDSETWMLLAIVVIMLLL